MTVNNVQEAVLPVVVPSGHSLGFSLALSDVSLAVGGLHSSRIVLLAF